jgi:hypothetical protein
VREELDSTVSGWDHISHPCELSNFQCSVRCKGNLDLLSDYNLRKKDPDLFRCINTNTTTNNNNSNSNNNHHLQSLGLLTCSDLGVRRIDLCISTVEEYENMRNTSQAIY